MMLVVVNRHLNLQRTILYTWRECVTAMWRERKEKERGREIYRELCEMKMRKGESPSIQTHYSDGKCTYFLLVSSCLRICSSNRNILTLCIFQFIVIHKLSIEVTLSNRERRYNVAKELKLQYQSQFTSYDRTKKTFFQDIQKL